MKKSFLLLLIPFLVLFSCQSQNDDPEIFEAIVKDFFDGVEKRNLMKIKTITTEDYTFFTRGKILNFDSFENMLRNFPPVKTENTMEDVVIDVDTRIATMRYINHYTIYAGRPMTANFLESIVFKKEGGMWKIAFMHSTEIIPPKHK